MLRNKNGYAGIDAFGMVKCSSGAVKMLRPVRNFDLIKEMFRINVNSANRILTGLRMVKEHATQV